VPSARRTPQLAVLALGGALVAGSLAGCSTTQDKAAAQRAESARILKARAKRQQARKSGNDHADGPKTSKSLGKSAHRQEGKG
jgi:regulator of protease activity HflC (stomatin/prohibitin superfamily)